MKKIVIYVSALLALGSAASTATGAIALSNLTNPTVQSLIDQGSSGVTVGSKRFFDFTFSGLTNSGTRTAAMVAVQPITDNGEGLRFISGWLAINGFSDDVITYKVEETAPSQSIGTISLFSDGTAPVPGTNTFASTTLTARKTSGSVIANLTTFDDGKTTPTDTTATDINTASINFGPQVILTITDAINTVSTSGVATNSIIENTFVSIPEPTFGSAVFLPSAAVFVANFKRRSRKPVAKSR